MFQILPESEGNIIGLRAVGKLTDRDYREVLIPTLKELMNRDHGKIRLLCLMDEEFASVEAGAMWDDAKFFLLHKNDFEKMAIVGGPKWIELIMRLFAPLMKGDVKTFSVNQLREAWDWIRS
ncbi:MAG: STAS/SEC14 domain-containing protein [Cyanobacteriota bacterium]